MGWVLTKIDKLEIIIANYGPLSNVNAGPQTEVNINNNDKSGSCVFDIGEYWRNKKAIIVPQNKNDPKCFLWANTIAKFKPEKNAG